MKEAQPLRRGDVVMHKDTRNHFRVLGYDTIKTGFRAVSIDFGPIERVVIAEISASEFWPVWKSPITNWTHEDGAPIERPRICKTCLQPCNGADNISPHELKERYCEPWGTCSSSEFIRAIAEEVISPQGEIHYAHASGAV